MDEHPLSWCKECQRHRFKCTCDIKKHMYTVTYHLVIETGPAGVWCVERVRVIAYNNVDAREKVSGWLHNTPHIWSKNGYEMSEYYLPQGHRDITIIRVDKYLEDIGIMAIACNLSTVMPPEE